MWVEFVIRSCPAPRVSRRLLRFSSLDKNQLQLSEFQFDLETVDEEPLLGYATANFHLSVFIYLFSDYLYNSQNELYK